MQLVLSILILIGFLILVEELSRKFKYFAWTLFFILPMIFFPLWLYQNDFSLFFYIKTYSVVFSITFILAIQSGYIKKEKAAFYVLYAFLVVNIFEAVVQDIQGYSTAHYLNACAGMILILAIPGIQKMCFSELLPERDFLWNISYGWIIGYTLWNWTFVYLNFPEISAHHLAVLGAPLVISLIQRERWVQARVFTLGASLIATLSSFGILYNFIVTPGWYHPEIGMLLAILSLGLTGAVFINHVYQTHRKIR